MILPAGLPLLAYVSGSLLGWHRPEWCDAYWAGLFLSVPPALFLYSRATSAPGRSLPLLLCLVLTAALRTGTRLQPDFPQNHLVHHATGRPLLLESVLVRQPDVQEAFTRLLLEARAIRTSDGSSRTCGRAYVWVPGRLPDLRAGDILLAEVRLRIPRRLGNPGEPDRKARSFLEGVPVRGSVRDVRRVLRLGVAEGYRCKRFVQEVRSELYAFFGKERDPKVRGLLLAWFLGDRSGLTESLTAAFRSSGLAHLLAISGLHVGLVGLLAYGVLKALLKRSSRVLLRFTVQKVAVFGCLPLVAAYVVVVGSPMTAVRAAVMFALFAGSLLVDRARCVWNSLATAGLLILLWDPAALFSPSFVLSFAAVAGLLASASAEKPTAAGRPSGDAGTAEQLRRGIRARALRLFSATLAATIATAPLTAFYFNRVTPLAVLANLLVVPVVGWLVIPCGLVTSLTALVWSPAAIPLLRMTSAGTKWVASTAEIFAKMPFASLRVGRPSLLELAALYLFFFCWFGPRDSPVRRRILWLSVGLFCASIAWSISQSRSDPRFAVTFLAVGQGDGMLVEFPGGRRMIVDGGPARKGHYDAGRSVVAPFLGYRRMRRLDLMAASHGQADHYGGLAFLAGEFAPDELWIGPERGCEGEGYRGFVRLCRSKGMRIRTVCRGGSPFSINGVRVEVWNPPCPGEGEGQGAEACEPGINDQSLVLRLTYGAVSVLLTGDIEEKAEQALLAGPERPEATLLKVPHHGSAGSGRPGLLDAVRPAVAVVSAGYRNHFGFPAEEVLRRYRDRGILVYRTDLDGAVRFSTDGRSVRIETFGETRR